MRIKSRIESLEKRVRPPGPPVIIFIRLGIANEAQLAFHEGLTYRRGQDETEAMFRDRVKREAGLPKG